MTKIITDNSKVNTNLLKENELLKKQIKKLQLDKEALKKQLSIHVVGNSDVINDYGQYMSDDVGLGKFPDMCFEEWLKSEELQKRREKYNY